MYFYKTSIEAKKEKNMGFFDYDNLSKYYNHFRKLPKRYKFFVIIIIILWVWYIFNGYAKTIESLNDRITQKDERISSLEADNAKLHRENLYLKETIYPFETKAQELYPELEINAAIAKLAEDIKSVRELATQGEYRPLDTDLKQEIIISLKAVFLKYREIKFEIIVSVEKGNKSRELIADELVEIFLNSGFAAKKQLTSVMAEKIPPLAIYLNPEAKEFASEIISSLKPFLNTTFEGKLSEHREKEDIGIGIYGEPQFLPRGAVVFK